MKMAKASEADMNMALELTSALEAISNRWGPCMPAKIEKLAEGDEGTEHFELADHSQCIRVIQYLQQLTHGASLGRVVWGMATLLDPANCIVDPALDVLEHHPDVKAALVMAKAAAPQTTVRDAADAVRFRALLDWWFGVTPSSADLRQAMTPEELVAMIDAGLVERGLVKQEKQHV